MMTALKKKITSFMIWENKANYLLPHLLLFLALLITLKLLTTTTPVV